MANPTPTNGDLLRRALVKMDTARVLAAVDSLNLKGQAGVTPVVGFPLRSLQQKRDVAGFAATAPVAAVAALIELLAGAPLERVVDALGGHAESPTYEQLSVALDQVITEGTSDDEVVAVLAYAIAEGFPAAPHCRRLLDERPAWALPEIDVAPPPSPLAPRERDEVVRAQRRARRAERKKPPAAPPRPVRRSRGPKSPEVPRERAGERSAAPPVGAPEPTRRRLPLTPAESARFGADHPLSGTVVMVELPFDAVDPEQPEQRAKERPALVVAASDSGVLVRGIYSNPSTTRTLFQPWRRVGLDHPSYLAVDRVAIEVGDLASLTRLGQVSPEEWNSTF